MWFGDLVTMRWWNGIWLNEAFATFMSYLCVDAMEPTWQVFDSVLTSRVRAFEVDSLTTTRPIEFPVGSPDEANGMFDILTYTKGGAVLRMIEQWLGPDDVPRRDPALPRDARLRQHRDARPVGRLAAASGQPVRRIMEPWVFQPGYPSVSAERDGDRIRLTQHRFAPSLPDDTSTWPIPLIVRQVSPDGRGRRARRGRGGRPRAAARPIPMRSSSSNAGSTAFVRTFYDDDLRARLVARAQTDSRPAERLSLVDDAWATVVAGRRRPSPPSSTWRPGSATRRHRPSGRPCSPAWTGRSVRGGRGPRAVPRGRPVTRAARRCVRLGWDVREIDTPDDLELRGDLIRAMGILGDDRETQAIAREDEAQVRAGHPVDPAVASAAIDVVAFIGDARDYDVFVAADAGGDDAAGPGPVSIRAADVPRSGADAANLRTRRVRRDPRPGRPVHPPGGADEPRPRRRRVAIRARPLGVPDVALRRPEHHRHRPGCPVAERPGRRGRCPGLLRRRTTSRRTTSRCCRRWSGNGCTRTCGRASAGTWQRGSAGT